MKEEIGLVFTELRENRRCEGLDTEVATRLKSLLKRSSWGCSAVFDGGLIGKQDGDAISNGVGAVASGALQGLLLLVERKGSLAYGTDEDIEKVLRDCHISKNLELRICADSKRIKEPFWFQCFRFNASTVSLLQFLTFFLPRHQQCEAVGCR